MIRLPFLTVNTPTALCASSKFQTNRLLCLVQCWSEVIRCIATVVTVYDIYLCHVHQHPLHRDQRRCTRFPYTSLHAHVDDCALEWHRWVSHEHSLSLLSPRRLDDETRRLASTPSITFQFLLRSLYSSSSSLGRAGSGSCSNQDLVWTSFIERQIWVDRCMTTKFLYFWIDNERFHRPDRRLFESNHRIRPFP